MPHLLDKTLSKNYCHCLDNLTDSFIQSHGFEWVKFDMSNIKDLSDKEAKYKTGQGFQYGYTKIVKGQPRKKTGRSFIHHIFCPFCGIKF